MFAVDELLLRKVGPDSVLDGFDCGNGSIQAEIKDGYYLSLLKQAYAYEICIADRVIGHYRLSIAQFDFENGYNVEAVGNRYSAIKIDYLAIDRQYQRRGNGTAVLAYIAKRASKYSLLLPLRFLVLDALQEKIPWYLEKGFKLYDDTAPGKNAETVFMYMDLCDTNKLQEYCDSLV